MEARKFLTITLAMLLTIVLFDDPSEAARRAKKRAARMDPYELSIQTVHEMAKSYVKRNNYGRAIEMYEIILDRLKFKRVINKEWQTELYYDVSTTFMNAGAQKAFKLGLVDYYNLAIEYANISIKMTPEFWPAYENMAIIYARTGDYERAMKYYEKIEDMLDKDSEEYNKILDKHAQIAALALKTEKDKEREAAQLAEDGNSKIYNYNQELYNSSSVYEEIRK